MCSVPGQGGTRKAARIPLACYSDSILERPGMLLPVEGGESTGGRERLQVGLEHLCGAPSS